jgi:hypothetical protein
VCALAGSPASMVPSLSPLPHEISAARVLTHQSGNGSRGPRLRVGAELGLSEENGLELRCP